MADQLSHDGRTTYVHRAEVVFFNRHTRAHDPFPDTFVSGGPQNAARDKKPSPGTQMRDQMIDYATKVMGLQHRTFLYCVCITGHYASLVCFDRAGAIFSETFNYVKTQWLAEFLWRCSHAAPADRRFDATVTGANTEECEALLANARDYLNSFTNAEYRMKMAHALDTHYPAYKIRVTDNATDEASEYIVGRPFFEAPPFSGCATRGYIAWGTKEKKLRVLKDTWRADVPGVLSESDVYKLLEDLEVDMQYLPTVCKSGDVKDANGKTQCTLTNEDAIAHSSGIFFRRHIHHRVVQELALPLYMVQSSLQLVKASRNVLIGES